MKMASSSRAACCGITLRKGDPFGPALNSPPQPFVQPYREGDLDVYVQEARTGRLMFGAGVNSDSGVVGNIVLDERNFDLFRPPTSVEDIIEGRAFRGGGQTFRLEAVPGSQVSRYSASWTNPYFPRHRCEFGAERVLLSTISRRLERAADRWSSQPRLSIHAGMVGRRRAYDLEDVRVEDPTRGSPSRRFVGRGGLEPLVHCACECHL